MLFWNVGRILKWQNRTLAILSTFQNIFGVVFVAVSAFFGACHIIVYSNDHPSFGTCQTRYGWRHDKKKEWNREHTQRTYFWRQVYEFKYSFSSKQISLSLSLNVLPTNGFCFFKCFFFHSLLLTLTQWAQQSLLLL